MSNGYGVDFYGVAFYGYSQPADYSVAPFQAHQSDYEKLTLTWASPNKTPWKSLLLTRSIYGYPSTPADGQQLATFTPATISKSYDDPGLTPGRIYYYTMFIGLEAPTWSVGTTYGVGQVVLYNNLYWSSLTTSNVGNTPAVGSSFWVNTQYQPVWFPAGYTAGLAMTNYGYTSLLYNRTPQPYKVANSDLFANTVVDNPALFHYLSLFGFHLDMTKTEYDLYLQGNNPDIISGTNLDFLGKQFGFDTDYVSSPQLRRQRVKNATINYRLKGTIQSIHNAIAAITGWDSVVSPSINMLHDGDQSSLNHPQYDLWNQATTYFPNQLIQFNGYNYKNLVQSYGVAQQPSGTSASNTWWQPQISTTSSAIIDNTTLRNPANYLPSGSNGIGGFSTWYPSTNVIYNTNNLIQDGVVLGLPHPTISSIQNWTALSYHDSQSSTIDKLANAISGIPNITVWSNSVNYVRNNWVSVGSRNFYALKPSGPGTPYGFITPGTNDTFWFETFVPLTTNNVELPLDSVAIPLTQQWNSSTKYTVGTQVQYFGIIYQAINTNINSKPSGYYYSNADWIYIQPAENLYTASAYEARLSTSTAVRQALVDTEIYDSSLKFQNNFVAGYSAYLARFDGDYADLNGINDNTLAALGRPWTATPSTAKLWRSNYGMASVDQTLFGSTTYVYLTVADGRADVTLGITFVTDYVDSAHVGHGIIFRQVDANNFWYVTRKTLYKVVSGTETVVASWTRLNDGDRIMVQCLGSSIAVIKYNRDGAGGGTTIASITDSALSTATIHGLIQKYSPSGAV